LKSIFEKIFKEGTVPKCFKSGIITPVYKKQDKPINNPNSYRRITVKAFEASMKAANKDSLLSRDSAIASVNNRLAFVGATFLLKPLCISAEHFKFGGSSLVYLLKSIFEKIFKEGTVPKCFKSGIITPVYKKQDKPINNLLYLIYNCYDKSLQFLYNLVEQILDTLH
jgi:hypothetical protein